MLPIPLAPNAYGYPLLIEQILTRSMFVSATQEIVSGSDKPLSYVQLTQCIGQVANTHKTNGISEGLRVGVMEEIQSRVGLGEPSKWAVPDDIVFIDLLPRISAGKLGTKVIEQDISTRSDIRS